MIESIYDKINTLSKQSPRSRLNVSLQYIAVDDNNIHDLLKPTTQTNSTYNTSINQDSISVLENITTVDIVGWAKDLSGHISKGIQASRLLPPSNSKLNQPYHLPISFSYLYHMLHYSYHDDTAGPAAPYQLSLNQL